MSEENIREVKCPHCQAAFWHSPDCYAVVTRREQPTAMDTQPCPECGVYPGHGHHHECSRVTLAQLREHMKNYYKAWSELNEAKGRQTSWLMEKVKSYAQKALAWQAKFMIVKRENAQLRKRIVMQTVVIEGNENARVQGKLVNLTYWYNGELRKYTAAIHPDGACEIERNI